ncbi:MAG TPA: hypothetical protein VMW72_12610 [Sedimentisphaerales bacterium]|nr:hypothetical protein [Sedimentisphaerales bacterium]
MSKNLLCLILFAVVVMAAPVGADTLTGLADVTEVDGAIVSLRYEGTEYVVEEGDLTLGTTTRWYVPTSGVETLWEDGTPVPEATVSGTSTVKAGDIGPKADNFLFTLNGATNISSIDGIDFQETIFPIPANTFFHFERGGNDTGTWQAIRLDGSLGPPIAFTAAAVYADTGVGVNGQNAYGVVFTTDVPVMGVRITASGHDTFSISVPTVIPVIATKPIPADGALHEDIWVNLSWSPGRLAVSHDLYLGDNFDDVDSGAEGTFVGNQETTFYVAGFPGFAFPDGLVPGKTYYWRVDEVNDSEPNSPWKGDVWSFSIPPKTAYSPEPADGAEAIDINSDLSWTGGFSVKLHTVYFGDNFDDVSNAASGLPQGTATYNPGTLELAKTYYWRVDEFDIIETYKGDVWSFTTEGAVEAVDPTNGAVDVTQTPVLTWAPGLGASHEVYFGANAASLELKGSGNLGSESYEPGLLEWNTTYYWRIDEANNANADSPWTGPLWSFTTANFLIVDDMESYNDINEGEPGSNRIYLEWVDGFENPAVNGSVVGNLNPPIAEQTIVHSGNQSMPMAYDNAVGKSEATLTLTSNRNWTVKGVDTLTIWHRGGSANAAEQMYVVLNGSAVVNHDNPDAALVTAWTAWNIDLQAFADQGVNLTNVNSITLGLGNRNNPIAGGTGMMYFDDIRLYKPTEPAQ